MGKEWDKALPSVDIWKEVYRVMKNGAFGFILCIPRQDCLSRMMISLEDAGFNINFSSIYWTYATGFPKAMNIGKKIDKRLGKEREVIGSKKCTVGGGKTFHGEKYKLNEDIPISTPSSNEAKQMEGSYGGFQPKPAVEVIIVVMKPLSEKSYIDQAMKDGKGVTWFDDCRIPYKDSGDYHTPYKADGSQGGNTPLSNLTYDTKDDVKPDEQRFNEGRFPANLLISDDILDDNKSHISGKNKSPNENSNDLNYNSKDGFHNMKIKSSAFYFDKGGYSRFFSLDAWAERNLPFLIVPKAAKKEKNLGVNCENEEYVCDNCGNKVMLCFFRPDQPCGSCGGKIVKKMIKQNIHPTVKPIKLMSYLITMGSRPGDTILDPFAGSGTTGCAAVTLGRKYVLIEQDPEYIKIIKARLKYWSSLPSKL